MLTIAHSIKELSFPQLMEVYAEGNLENAEEFWPELPAGQQLLRAEQEFRQYLQEVFFPTPGAIYAILQAEGRYVSALRLEPYRDGLLLEALETHPMHRRQGYAAALIGKVLEYLPEGTKVYSHVSKRNIPSLKTHEKCGFRKILDYAVYADGSVLHSSVTLLKK